MAFFKKTAEAREVIVAFRVVSLDVTEKETRKHLQKCLPSITEKGMNVAIEHLRHTGCIDMRVTKKEGEQLLVPDKFRSRYQGGIKKWEEEACGGCDEVCDHSCALSYLDSRFFGETNLGIIDESGIPSPWIHEEGDG